MSVRAPPPLVGVLGGGQLGRMLALAGYPLGLRFRHLDRSEAAPAGSLSELIVADFDDPAALDRLAVDAAVVTYEFENVPLAAVQRCAAQVPVRPASVGLATAQDRLSEKRLFSELGIPTPEFMPVDHGDQLPAALERIGLPAVLKTRRFGYDGKGQAVLRAMRDAPAAWASVGGQPALLEAWVPFERELSVVAARASDGAMRFYSLVENRHEAGILRMSIALVDGVATERQLQAEDYVGRIAEALDYIGVLTVEFFELGGRLLANEMAPRVHNSGHWTIEGAQTSQFENHLRAILGWPLGSTRALGHYGMVNLIGAAPALPDLLAITDAHVHLYGKTARRRRKLGHVTVGASSRAALETRLAELSQLARRAEDAAP